MKIQQKRTLKAFITTAATRCTVVRPIPSKNALMAIVIAIEITPIIRHREYHSATSRTSGTLIMNPEDGGEQKPADDGHDRAGDEAEPSPVREDRARVVVVSLGLPARRERLRPTLTADSVPPKAQTMVSDGRSAACPLDASGTGRREKKTTSISSTTLWASIATTVGRASLRIAA